MDEPSWNETHGQSGRLVVADGPHGRYIVGGQRTRTRLAAAVDRQVPLAVTDVVKGSVKEGRHQQLPALTDAVAEPP